MTLPASSFSGSRLATNITRARTFSIACSLLILSATAESMSPVEHVRSSTPPTIIVQGDADTLTPLSGAKRYCSRLVELGGTCELDVHEGVGHLLTRNLEYQEGDFDPDPEAVAEGIDEHLRFLRRLGFIVNE